MSAPDLSGKVALVAGATRGAGRAIAVELARATGDDSYLTAAGRLADASTRDAAIIKNGVLTEPCEAGGGNCGADGPSFKGAYIRGLGELNAAKEAATTIAQAKAPAAAKV